MNEVLKECKIFDGFTEFFINKYIFIKKKLEKYLKNYIVNEII